MSKPRPRELQRLREYAAHDEVLEVWWPSTPMSGPPLSSSTLVLAKNENETSGPRGRWATGLLEASRKG